MLWKNHPAVRQSARGSSHRIAWRMGDVFLLTFLLCGFRAGVWAQEEDSAEDEGTAAAGMVLVWTGTVAPAAWNDPANWENGLKAGPQEKRLVEVAGPASVTFSQDQSFASGLVLSTYSGSAVFDLGRHTAGVDGSLRFGGARNVLRIKNGTLVLGSSSRTAELAAWIDSGEGRNAFLGPELQIVPVRLNSIIVAESGGNRPGNGSLDMSGSSVSEGILGVDGEVAVGRFRLMSYDRGIQCSGQLKLPGRLMSFSVRDLILGKNARSGGSGQSASAHGVLEFSSKEPVQITIGRLLALGNGDNTSGEIRNLPEKASLRIGTPEAPGFVRLGFKDRSQSSQPGFDAAARGRLETAGGSARMNLVEMRIGQNTCAAGSAEGVLDLRACALESLDIHGAPQPEVLYDAGMKKHVFDRDADLLKAPRPLSGTLIIGCGRHASGALILPEGTASAAWAVVGDGSEGSQGRLELHGTRLILRQRLSVGAGGTVLLHAAQGRVPLIDLGTAAAAEPLQVAPPGKIEIRMDEGGISAGAEILRVPSSAEPLIDRLLAARAIAVAGAPGWTLSKQRRGGTVCLTLER